MSQKERPSRRKSTNALRAEIEKARNEAVRESFRAGGALADLQRASDELQVTMIEMDRAVWKTSPKV
jgi:hypothetical protein